MNGTPTVNRRYKDSLFRMIFRGKEELLSLYNALNDSNYTNLYEAQSTWNPNMPLRGVFYFSRLYQGYVAERDLDIYSKKIIRIPTPKYIVFYNGADYAPEQQKLQLSDSFIKKDGTDYALECTVTVLNINKNHNHKIMDSCKKLHDYSYLVEEIRKRLHEKQPLKEAIDQAIKYCIQEGILDQFLRKHRAEVTNVILSEYNEELHLRTTREEGHEEGYKEGHKEGRGEMKKELANDMIKSGYSDEQICTLLKYSPEEVDDLRKSLLPVTISKDT